MISSTEKEKELLKLGDQAMCLANDKFGISGWSHSVTHQSVDFIDSDDNQTYEVGVSALVKVTLKDGCFHEHVGFGLTKGRRNKGFCIAKARKLAANDALLNALRAFGTEFQDLVPSGKITEYLSPIQKVSKLNQPSISGVKRKLVLGGDNSNDSLDHFAQTVTMVPFPFPVSQSNENKKRIVLSEASPDSFEFTEQPEVTISIIPPNDMQNPNVSANTQASSARGNDTDCMILENSNGASEDGIPQMQLRINPQSRESPLDENKRRRKIRQLQLEIEAREALKNELIQVQSKENNSETVTMKNEKQDDFYS